MERLNLPTIEIHSAVYLRSLTQNLSSTSGNGKVVRNTSPWEHRSSSTMRSFSLNRRAFTRFCFSCLSFHTLDRPVKRRKPDHVGGALRVLLFHPSPKSIDVTCPVLAGDRGAVSSDRSFLTSEVQDHLAGLPRITERNGDQSTIHGRIPYCSRLRK
jgi:hypothetical protein